MASINLPLPGAENNDSRFARGGLPRPVEVFETPGGREPGGQAEVRREKARLKFVLELTRQTVSHQELGNVVRAAGKALPCYSPLSVFDRQSLIRITRIHQNHQIPQKIHLIPPVHDRR